MFSIEGEVKIYAKEKSTGRIVKVEKANSIVYSARNILADMLADQLAGATTISNQLGYMTFINDVPVLPTNVRDDSGDAPLFANTVNFGPAGVVPLAIDLTSATQAVGALTITNNSTVSYSPITGAVDANYASVVITSEMEDGVIVAGLGVGEDHIRRIAIWDIDPVPLGVPDPAARVFSVATLPSGVLITPGLFYIVSYSFKIR